MNDIFVDESGYTGRDLLNNSQKFQGASAISITDYEAARLIGEFFPRIKAQELKYRDLVRKSKNHQQLFELQKVLLSDYKSLSYVCDKKYVLILIFLAHAVEPFYHENGINFYENGNNYAMASVLYYTGEKFWGKGNFYDVLYLFQHAIWSKTDVAIQCLVQKIKSLRGKELKEWWAPLAMEYPACLTEITSKKTNTDAAFIVLLSIISRLETILECEYKVVHDNSKNLERYNKLLGKLISHQDSVEFRSTELTKMNFPLKLASVTQVDSKNCRGVQLADVLIGGVMDFANACAGLKEKNDYNQATGNLYSENQLLHLLPSTDFDEQFNFRKNTQSNELIDYLTNHFS